MQASRLLVGLLSGISITTLAAGAPVPSSMNDWRKATSGYWEEKAFWSLGRLPAAGDTVSFANEGFKALAIGSITASNYPASLSMERLIVHGSNNLLLLNWAGKAVPLQIATDFDLFSGASLHCHSSVIEASTFNNGGRAMFGDEAVANFGTAYIGHGSGPGELIISNAVISSDRMFVGYGGASTVNQYGGTNRVMRGAFRNGLVIEYAGAYNLKSGTLEAQRVDVFNSTASPAITVSGGLMRVPNGIGAAWDFLLEGGTLEAGWIEFLRAGRFRQIGGKNVAGTILLPGTDYLDATYVLSGGTLKSSNVVLGAYWGSQGYFEQTGGDHTNRSMTLWGYDRTRQHHVSGWYTLGSGRLVSELIDIYGGSFYQGGGSNLVDTVHVSASGGYVMSNGFIRASNIVVSSQGVTTEWRSYFYQAGGRIHIENGLYVAGGSTFRVDAGVLSVANIDVYGRLVASASVTNSTGIKLGGGAVVLSGNQTHHFGQLDLEGGGAVMFPDAPATVRFKESRDIAWDSGATLVVTNWSGSTNGGGAQRIIIGSSAQGISLSQLRQVQFEDPAGFARGMYPARILATGEIVPTEPVRIGFAKGSSALTLSWSGNYELLSATNVAGPYTRVDGASSPYTNSFGERRRFFQLRAGSL
jgi:hypothetical protein